MVTCSLPIIHLGNEKSFQISGKLFRGARECLILLESFIRNARGSLHFRGLRQWLSDVIVRCFADKVLPMQSAKAGAFAERKTALIFFVQPESNPETSCLYDNPKRQRGIWGNTAETAKTQSLADASGWDSHKRATSRGESQCWPSIK